MTAAAIARAGAQAACRPWPRFVLSGDDWARFAAAAPELIGVWADSGSIHAAILDPIARTPLIASVAAEAWTRLASLNADAFERAIGDLWGHAPLDGDGLAPWLDRGRWPLTKPLAPRPGPPRDGPFHEDAPDAGMRVPVGPVAGGIQPAAGLRVRLDGARVADVEIRLGATHRGALAQMRGKSPRAAARYAARLAGDSTVAHALAFAQAAEAAAGAEVPPRAQGLRAMLLEWERMAHHLDAFADITAALGAPGPNRDAALLREYLARALEAAFGHRMAMDVVVPGGLSSDLPPEGARILAQLAGAVADALPRLSRALSYPPIAARLGGLGSIDRATADAYALGGPAGRAAMGG